MTTNNNNNKQPYTLSIHGTLPWDSLPGDRLRQWSILVILALLSLLLIILIEASPRIEKDRFAEQEVPERLAKLVMERKKEEPPPPPPKRHVVFEPDEDDEFDREIEDAFKGKY